MKIQTVFRQAWILILIVFLAVLAAGAGAADGSEHTPTFGAPRFSLKIGGGFGFLPGRGGDLDLLRHHMEYEYTSREPAVKAEFDWNPMSSGNDVFAEFIIRLKPHLGIGLGTGILTTTVQATYEKDYTKTFSGSDWTMSDKNHYETARDFKIRLIPVRINFYLSYPLGQLTIYSYGGLGFYSGKLAHSASAYTELKYEYSDSSGYSTKDEDYDERTIEENAGKSGLGFQGGLGAELTLMRNLSLGLEVFGHHFNDLGWRGSSSTDFTTTSKYWNSREGWHPDVITSGSREDEGALWYMHNGSAKDDIYVGDERNVPLFFAKREARIDLRTVGVHLMLNWHFGGSMGTGPVKVPGSSLSRFSLKLGSGFGFLPDRGGDLELLRLHLEDLYGVWAGEIYYATTFDWKPITHSYELPLELIILFNPQVGISLGSGMLTAVNYGSCTWDYDRAAFLYGSGWAEDNHVETAHDFKIRVIPAWVNLYLFQPIGALTVFSYGGLGFCWGTLTHSSIVDYELKTETRWFYSTPPSHVKREEYGSWDIDERLHKGSLGFQGGVGGEVTLFRHLALGLEVCGRHLAFAGLKGSSTNDYTALIKSWDQTHGWYPDSTENGSLRKKGTLWYSHIHDPFLDKGMDIFVVEETGTSENALHGPKNKARIDLSSVSIRLTLRIHFGRSLS